jgi:hypothetical protein
MRCDPRLQREPNRFRNACGIVGEAILEVAIDGQIGGALGTRAGASVEERHAPAIASTKRTAEP